MLVTQTSYHVGKSRQTWGEVCICNALMTTLVCSEVVLRGSNEHPCAACIYYEEEVCILYCTLRAPSSQLTLEESTKKKRGVSAANETLWQSCTVLHTPNRIDILPSPCATGIIPWVYNRHQDLNPSQYIYATYLTYQFSAASWARRLPLFLNTLMSCKCAEI
jgi:hypothetical protein